MTDERTTVSGLAHGAADALDEIAALRKTIKDRHNQLARALGYSSDSWEMLIARVRSGYGSSDALPAVLGWSNADTGPVGLRLYALDQGDSPRWARPHARVAEQALMEAGASEGDRYRIVRQGDRFS